MKNFELSWNDEKGKKSIEFNFSYDSEKELINAIITLRGNSEAAYRSWCAMSRDDWEKDAEKRLDLFMSMVVNDLFEMDTLPISEDIDPDILNITKAIYKVGRNVKRGRVTWPDEEDEYVIDLDF